MGGSFKLPLPPVDVVRAQFTYDPDTGVLTRKKGRTSRKPNGSGYLTTAVGETRYVTHRLIWLWMTGDDPGEADVDHENRVRHDNRWNNLRILNRSGNNANKPAARGKTLPKGVYLTHNDRYLAMVRRNKKTVFSKVFDTPLEASEAYVAHAALTYPDVYGAA